MTHSGNPNRVKDAKYRFQRESLELSRGTSGSPEKQMLVVSSLNQNDYADIQLDCTDPINQIKHAYAPPKKSSML